MMKKCCVLVGVCAAVIVLATAALADGEVMKMVAVTIPVPNDDEPDELPGLKYGAPWVAEFTSIRLQRDADPGADPQRPLWTITGSSDRARPIRVQLVLTILNREGEFLASTKKMVFLKNNQDNQEFEIKMKLKAERWSRAAKIKIRVNYLIGT